MSMLSRLSPVTRVFGGVRQPLHQARQSIRVKLRLEITLEFFDSFAVADAAADCPCIKPFHCVQPFLESPPMHLVHRFMYPVPSRRPDAVVNRPR